MGAVHISDLQQRAQQNDYFREVVATSDHAQVVIMSIPVGGEIGEEIHPDNDQILYLVEGNGEVVLDGQTSAFATGDLVVVPAGTKHNFITKDAAMKIITVYSPPHHPEGTIHKTKAEADAAESPA